LDGREGILNYLSADLLSIESTDPVGNVVNLKMNGI
jgi:hypothetical protein